MLLITIVIHKLRHGAPATMLNYNPLGGLELWAPQLVGFTGWWPIWLTKLLIAIEHGRRNS